MPNPEFNPSNLEDLQKIRQIDGMWWRVGFSYACLSEASCNNGGMPKTQLGIEGFTPLTTKEIIRSFDFRPEKTQKKPNGWYKYCQYEQGLFEYPTVEFVRGLGNYLTSRVVELRLENTTTRILEVAAGRGLLSALVSQVLQENGVEHTVHAVDDKSNVVFNPKFSVSESLDFREGIAKYRPHIILGAWLPGDREYLRETGWTRHFRNNPETQEYLLIGEPEQFAHPLDWGQESEAPFENSPFPEYAQDGFERVDLNHLQPTQICFKSNSLSMHPSATVAFRRM